VGQVVAEALGVPEPELHPKAKVKSREERAPATLKRKPKREALENRFDMAVI
jgi:hypothetical protein